MRSSASLILDDEIQSAVDSLKKIQAHEASKSYPVNPNYLSDYQAYRLGLSTSILDSIRSFQEAGGTIYSLEQFRGLVDIPDSLMERIGPQLKFPTRRYHTQPNNTSNTLLRDLNTATAQELRRIHGIGQVLSGRIIKFRTALGGFLQNEQVHDVYGLDSAVVRSLLSKFKVKQAPVIEKIPINSASAEELASNVYITWDLAREIVAYRERHGTIESWSVLEELQHLPNHRIARIRLYLSLEKKLLE